MQVINGKVNYVSATEPESMRFERWLRRAHRFGAHVAGAPFLIAIPFETWIAHFAANNDVFSAVIEELPAD